MPTSERLYYSDSFLTTFAGTITAVRELPVTGGEPIWQLALDRSAFYPTSGGQPFDTGLLRTTSGNAAPMEVLVEQVEEDEEGLVWHFVRRPLATGTPIEGQIYWNRRFDHMQQHTGQHLLSAVFHRELHAPTVSFHLGESTSTIDLASGPLAHHSLERVERIANEIIAEDRPVTVDFVSRSDAQEMLAAGELRKLPEREGTIRLVNISDLDRNACGGTHLRSTGQIGGLLVRRTEKVSRGVRIEFVCGLRAVRAARADAGVLGETAALLSSAAAEVPAAVGRLLAEAKASTRQRQKLQEELAILQAEKLAQEVPFDNGVRLVQGEWKDRDRDYVRLLASRTAAVAAFTAVIFCARDSDPVRIFVARSKDLDFDCGRILRDALTRLGLRGGGSPDLAQGDIPAQKEPELRRELVNAIRGAVSGGSKER